jgi:hypothetical protein
MRESSSPPPVRPLRNGWFVGLAILAVASSGALVSYHVSHQLLMHSVRTRLKDLVTVVAAEIDPDLHTSITTSKDTGSLEYRQAVEPLLCLRKAVPDLHYAYTLRQGQQGFT